MAPSRLQLAPPGQCRLAPALRGRPRDAGVEQPAAALAVEARAIGIAGEQTLPTAAGFPCGAGGRGADRSSAGLYAERRRRALLDGGEARLRGAALFDQRADTAPDARAARGWLAAPLLCVAQRRASAAAAPPTLQRIVADLQALAIAARTAHDAGVATVERRRIAAAGWGTIGDAVAAVATGAASDQCVAHAAPLTRHAVLRAATLSAERSVAQRGTVTGLEIQPGIAPVAAALQQIARAAILPDGARRGRAAAGCYTRPAQLRRRARRIDGGDEIGELRVADLQLAAVAALLARRTIASAAAPADRIAELGGSAVRLQVEAAQVGVTDLQLIAVADVLAGRAMRCLTAWHACGSAQFAERFCRAAIQCLPARAPRIAALEDAAVTA